MSDLTTLTGTAIDVGESGDQRVYKNESEEGNTNTKDKEEGEAKKENISNQMGETGGKEARKVIVTGKGITRGQEVICNVTRIADKRNGYDFGWMEVHLTISLEQTTHMGNFEPKCVFITLFVITCLKHSTNIPHDPPNAATRNPTGSSYCLAPDVGAKAMMKIWTVHMDWLLILK
eukprot:4021636-Ditylum_brightwellii.AAC.1